MKECTVFCTCKGWIAWAAHLGLPMWNVLALMMKPAAASLKYYCGRWMLVGAYVGFATVGAFCVWYMFDSFLGLDLSGDGHSTVTFNQLRNWEQCRTWPDFKVRLCIVQGRVTHA